MSTLAWLLIAAILIAWAAEAIWQHIDRRRDERDWQAMVDEAESSAANWHAACRLHERNVSVLREQLADQETLLVVAAAENERLTDAASRSLPPAPWPGEPLRVKEIAAAEEAVLAKVAVLAPEEVPIITARIAARKKRGGAK